jgi:hypothetical protein
MVLIIRGNCQAADHITAPAAPASGQKPYTLRQIFQDIPDRYEI